MKYINSIIVTLTLTIIISACDNSQDKNIPSNTDEQTIEQPHIDDMNIEETAADTSSTRVYKEEVIETDESIQEAIKLNTKEVIEIEGMSFCDCVKKNKELSDIMMADETNDADFDIAMEELETMKTGECKIMFPQQNNIEEQQAHQLKVNNCLR